MKQRPILFNGEMVRAILEGRKTQTRRVVKPQPVLNLNDPNEFLQVGGQNSDKGMYSGDVPYFWNKNEMAPDRTPCPFGRIGDWLWVRETHAFVFRGKNEKSHYGPDHNIYCEVTDDGHFNIEYAADPGEKDWEGGWKPSIHMPRWASRITLEIKNVRVERLQEISEQDAKAEGCPESWSSWEGIEPEECPIHHGAGSISAFANLWNSVYKNWDANPWVWVIEFQRIEKT